MKLSPRLRYWLQTLGCLGFIPLFAVYFLLLYGFHLDPEPFLFPFSLVLVAAYLYVIVDMVYDDLNNQERFTWFIVLFLLGMIGGLIYWSYRVHRKVRFYS